MVTARSVHVRGVVQGVGFRPFVYRLARANTLTGWVLNEGGGVEIHLEGEESRLDAFLRALETESPGAAAITAIAVEPCPAEGIGDFTIRESRDADRPSARISPDLATCPACLAELLDPTDRRCHYPYINCTECGPRYSIILGLPYDRAATTMRDWELDPGCAAEYHDPASRRFHAEPVACPECGPGYRLARRGETVTGDAVIPEAAAMLRAGKLLAVKGIGGYHLACDAANRDAVAALRGRKYRKEKPFAVMARNVEIARRLVALDADGDTLLRSRARPIVVAPALVTLPGVAPDNRELGVMLPYAPLHYLLFAAGAPEVLVMTSANRSSEPIAYRDGEALERLAGIADGFLIGERPIARRVEDSVARSGPTGPMILRRSRGYAPEAVAAIPSAGPILAVGADLKSAVTLVVDGQAFVSQHLGDLDDYDAFVAFAETVRDLLAMYRIPAGELTVVHDAHPEYRSTGFAETLGAAAISVVQHHRAHVASVLAERGEWDERVLGISFDGTGWGDDGTIWGGEVFVGAVRSGLARVAHLRPAALPGGDAAARHPVQAAAGFLVQLGDLPDLGAAPFRFPDRYRDAARVALGDTRRFTTTSAGRLFDAAAALVGFVRPITFEGQAAIWLEQQAAGRVEAEPYPFPFRDGELDWRPLLGAVVRDRRAGRPPEEIAAGFHAGVAGGLAAAAGELAATHRVGTVAISGGVFQNRLLVEGLVARLQERGLGLLANRAVPPNDGGVSLGQAALAAVGAPAAG